ncbi:DUF2891 domain-containing protein [Halopseudomonas pelagia]|uniref:DUF2891 domain-containing protein n=1 Tax=Halopseudomonas pelagia TaxID=553151 RepID=UPI0003A90A93|nr:DUF2891 domain-containing protein [Halopseudomonas pelagia]|tara:strand:- start:732 stop:1718 length:987 start_codon:yes stop_codon:yes gene_type:complete
MASRFARIALGHVRREFPHSGNLRLNSAADLALPHQHHPIFYGSYDWHSCVHSYWLLARLLRTCPDLPEAPAIVALFDQQLTDDKVAGEMAYFMAPGRQGFERPYGWAWLLKLAHELSLFSAATGAPWRVRLQPLVNEIAGRLVAYLPKLGRPIRSGSHSNTAFALTLALEYAHQAADAALQQTIHERALGYFQDDRDCHPWEPGGEDFLSPSWQQALLMRQLLTGVVFQQWFSAFLPNLAAGQPDCLLQPASPADRSDGRLAHLDGLNLSRAWCMRSLAAALPVADARRQLLERAAQAHLQAGLAHLQDDYMGEHWLATFALLALAD